MIDKLLIPTGKRPGLAKRATGETFGWDKEQAKEDLGAIVARLSALQRRLYAEGSRALLVVFQAMDAAGKDGTIRSIFTGLNPAGVQVTSFKVPAGSEVAHDYLWRVHGACPGRGQIGVFNRSHYEDVLVVRVHQLVPEERWRPRFAHIRAFEQLLTDEGTTIVKIHLHISADEQRERLQARLDDPEARWKFRAGDLDDRKLWKQFQEAYEEAIAETSTDHAPWYVVPADHKWARNLAVAHILLDTMERMDPQLPEPEAGIENIRIV